MSGAAPSSKTSVAPDDDTVATEMSNPKDPSKPGEDSGDANAQGHAAASNDDTSKTDQPGLGKTKATNAIDSLLHLEKEPDADSHLRKWINEEHGGVRKYLDRLFGQDFSSKEIYEVSNPMYH